MCLGQVRIKLDCLAGELASEIEGSRIEIISVQAIDVNDIVRICEQRVGACEVWIDPDRQVEETAGFVYVLHVEGGQQGSKSFGSLKIVVVRSPIARRLGSRAFGFSFPDVRSED